VRSIPSPSRRDRRPHDGRNFVHLFNGVRPLLCTSKGLAAATLSALRRHFHIYFEVSRDLQRNSLPLRHLSSFFQPGAFVAEATFRWNPGPADEYMGPQQLPERLAELQLRLPSLRTIHIMLSAEVDHTDPDEPTVAFQEMLDFLRLLGHALPLNLTTSLAWDFWDADPESDESPVMLEHLKAVLGAIGWSCSNHSHCTGRSRRATRSLAYLERSCRRYLHCGKTLCGPRLVPSTSW
jgi:hypothetical protein